MNNVILIGRLTNEPEVRRTPEGKAIARYTLAVDRRGKDKGADFIRCTAFDNGADFAERYLHKGTKIALTGSIHTDSYTDREGRKVFTTEINVRDHEFCEPRSNASERTIGGENDYRRGNTYVEPGEGFSDAIEGLKGVPFR